MLPRRRKRGRSAIANAAKAARIQRVCVCLIIAMLLCSFALGGVLLVQNGVLQWPYAADEQTDDEAVGIPIEIEPQTLYRGVRIVSMTDERPSIDAAQTQEASLPAVSPRVLIYHTHATEAYRQTEDDPYEESGDWRTHDASKSVVALGKRLCELLNESYGICALHDTTDHEPPKLSSAYSRSLETMQAYQKRYATIAYFIDVHRDAYDTSEWGRNDYVLLDGVETARIMFVVGTGAGATGTGFDEMPDFASNLAFAQDVTNRLNAVNTALTREVRIKTGRYNQHVSPHCLLAEIGHNANTFDQAMASVDLLAKAIAESIYQAELNATKPDTIAIWAPQL